MGNVEWSKSAASDGGLKLLSRRNLITATLASILAISPGESMTSGFYSSGETVENLEGGIGLPKFTSSEARIIYPKPLEITVSDAEYEEAANLFVYKVNQHLIPKLERSFQMYPAARMHPEQRGGILVKFLSACIDSLNEDQIFSPLIEKHRNRQNDAVKIGKMLKPVFLRGGQYFDMRYEPVPGTGKVIAQMMVYEIKSTKTLIASDGDMETHVPVLTLGRRVFDLDEFSGSGLQDTDMNLALIFGENSKPEEKINTLISVGAIPQRPPDADQAIMEYNKDTERHEATHVFLSKRFEDLDIPSMSANFAINVGVPLNATGKRALGRGFYSLAHVHELAAVGNEIAQSESEFPLSHLMHYGSGGRESYALVQEMLAAMTIQALPEGDVKVALIESIDTESLKTGQLIRAALPYLDRETRQKIGTEMYRLAYSLFQGIQNGEIPLEK